MNYTNLAKSPDYYKDTIKLIEESFDYAENNKFDVDFYPLMNKSNHQNNHLLIKDDKVAAHIGVLEKTVTINNKTYPIAMYGGIAVNKDFRGQGLFKKLFGEVLSLCNSVVLHLLWSDQLDMYEKFGFYPAIEQIEFNQSLEDAEGFEPTSLNELSDKQIEQIKTIYNRQDDIRINRSNLDWEILKHITSTNLYIKKSDDNIQNYFFMNKGEDLNGVVIEVGDFKDLYEIKNFGITWSPKNYLDQEAENLYGAVVKIGKSELFSELIHNYSDNIVQNVEVHQSNIRFQFENNEFNMNPAEFLTGIFGPGKFDELNDRPPFYISGLDSI